MGSAAAGVAVNLGPRTDIGETGFGENFGALTDNDCFGLVDLRGKAGEGVG